MARRRCFLATVALRFEEASVSPETILLVVLLLTLFAVLPTWPHSSQWGYYPTLLVGVFLIIASILVKMGRI